MSSKWTKSETQRLPEKHWKTLLVNNIDRLPLNSWTNVIFALERLPGWWHLSVSDQVVQVHTKPLVVFFLKSYNWHSAKNLYLILQDSVFYLILLLQGTARHVGQEGSFLDSWAGKTFENHSLLHIYIESVVLMNKF